MRASDRFVEVGMILVPDQWIFNDDLLLKVDGFARFEALTAGDWCFDGATVCINERDLERDISEYAMRAREGKIKIEDLQGGTFTISNGGVYGSLMGTPILNPPQSGILGMHAIQQRPVAIKGEVVVRPMMYLALSDDHRAVDGKEAVTFLVKVKECIENPKQLGLEI